MPSDAALQNEIVEWAISKWQGRLGLSDWDITAGAPGIVGDPEDEDAWMYLVPTEKAAKVYVHPLAQRRAVIERLVVHELLHLLFNRLRDACFSIGSFTEGQMDHIHTIEETVINALATALTDSDWAPVHPDLVRRFG